MMFIRYATDASPLNDCGTDPPLRRHRRFVLVRKLLVIARGRHIVLKRGCGFEEADRLDTSLVDTKLEDIEAIVPTDNIVCLLEHNRFTNVDVSDGKAFALNNGPRPADSCGKSTTRNSSAVARLGADACPTRRGIAQSPP